MTAPPPDPELPREPEPPLDLEPLRDHRGTWVLPPPLLLDSLPELLPDEGLGVALVVGTATGTGTG